MKKIFRTAQFLANVSMIIVAIVLTAVLVKNHFFYEATDPTTSIVKTTTKSGDPLVTQPTPPKLATPVGKAFPLENIEWKDKNLVLYLSNTCRYCTESGGFYQRLVKETTGKEVKLLAVLPQSQEDGQTYLKDLGVGIDEVYSSGLVSIGVSATPTLLLVDSKGTVVDMWKGKQKPEGETRILDKLLN